MRFVTVICVSVFVVGCSRVQDAPTAPDSAISPLRSGRAARSVSSTSVWGMVIKSTGGCVDNATVEVVGGEPLGQIITQSTPCSVWDYGGGFFLEGLTPGQEITLRASAPGWSMEEKTFVPCSGWCQVEEIQLFRTE